MTILELIIIAYIVSNAFFTGMAFEEIRCDVYDFRSVIIAAITTLLFLAFGSIINLLGYFVGFFWWVIDRIDAYLNFKFYWKYFRGGYYNMGDHELKSLDRRVFARESCTKLILKHRHFIFCANLVFRRNAYIRKNWEIKDNFINEIQ